MKQTRLWISAAILSICGLGVLTSCSNDDDSDSKNSSVRLTAMHQVKTIELVTETKDTKYVWENGLLTHEVSSTNRMTNYEVEESYVYNDKKLYTEKHSSDGLYNYYFSYENDRLVKMEEKSNGKIIATCEASYNAEGNISEILYTYITAELKEVSMKYYLTWQDGDLTQAVIEYLSTERPSTTLTFLYDKYPSAYTGMPIGTSLIDPTALALHASKHNLIENGDNLVYYHGRLISIVSADSKTQTFFTYSDGTGKR